MQITVSKNTLLGLVLVLLSVLAVVNFIQIQSLKRSIESIKAKTSSSVALPLAAMGGGDHASHHGGATTEQTDLSLEEIAAAKKRMDPDGDTVCNTCGMKVDDCITAGMLECGS